jgi:nicotinamidase-related amidase
MENSPASYLRSGELLSRDSSRLVIVDVQEKLMPLIPLADQVVAQCGRLIDAAKIFHVPVFATEQYPKGLGPTVRALAERLESRPAKQRFTCAEVLGWGTAAEQPDQRHQVVVAGIESHVCVLQTVLDFLAAGFQVFVPADAVASRGALDRDVALNRMAGCGATIVTVESVLFEWCEQSGTPEFKQISQLVKEMQTGPRPS